MQRHVFTTVEMSAPFGCVDYWRFAASV